MSSFERKNRVLRDFRELGGLAGDLHEDDGNPRGKEAKGGGGRKSKPHAKGNRQKPADITEAVSKPLEETVDEQDSALDKNQQPASMPATKERANPTKASAPSTPGEAAPHKDMPGPVSRSREQELFTKYGYLYEDQKQRLRGMMKKLGYTKEQINAMGPVTALDVADKNNLITLYPEGVKKKKRFNEDKVERLRRLDEWREENESGGAHPFEQKVFRRRSGTKTGSADTITPMSTEGAPGKKPVVRTEASPVGEDVDSKETLDLEEKSDAGSEPLASSKEQEPVSPSRTRKRASTPRASKKTTGAASPTAPAAPTTPPTAETARASGFRKKNPEADVWGDALTDPTAAKAWRERMGMKGEKTYAEKKSELKGALERFEKQESALKRRLNNLHEYADQNDPFTQEYQKSYDVFKRTQRDYLEYKRGHIKKTGMWNSLWKSDTTDKTEEGKRLADEYENAAAGFEQRVRQLTTRRLEAMPAQEWEQLWKQQGSGLSFAEFKERHVKRKMDQAVSMLVKHSTVREAGVLEQQVIEDSFANRRQSGAEKAIRKAGEKFAKLPKPAKYAIGAAIGLGIGGATGAIAAVGVGAVAARIGFGMLGGAAGATAGSWIGGKIARLWGGHAKEEAREDLLQERSVRGAASSAGKQDIIKLLSSADRIQRTEKMIQAGTAVAGAVIGGGTFAAYGPGAVESLSNAGASTTLEPLIANSSGAGSEAVTAASEPISVTVGDGKGAISMFSDLKEQLAKEVAEGRLNPETASESVKQVLANDPGTLAKEYAFWNTAADAPGGNSLESALIQKGSTLGINAEGNLVFTQGGTAETVLTPESGFSGDFMDTNSAPPAPEVSSGVQAPPPTPDAAPGAAVDTGSETPEASTVTQPNISPDAKAFVEGYVAPRNIPDVIEGAAKQGPDFARAAAQHIAETQTDARSLEALAKSAKYLEPDLALKQALVDNPGTHTPKLYLLSKGEYALFSNPDPNMSALETYKFEISAAQEAAKQTGQVVNVPYPDGREYAHVLPNGEVRTYGGIWGSPPKWMTLDNAVLEINADIPAPPATETVAANAAAAPEQVVQPQGPTIGEPVTTPEQPSSAPETPAESVTQPQQPEAAAPQSIAERLEAVKPTGANGAEAKIPAVEMRDGTPMFKQSEWTKMKYWADDKNLYVVGESTSKNAGFAMQAADFRARADVLKIIGQESARLSGSTSIDYWQDPKTGKLFSLLKVPKAGIQ